MAATSASRPSDNTIHHLCRPFWPVVSTTIGCKGFAGCESEVVERLRKEPQLGRCDQAAAVGQLVHDGVALGVRKPRPGGDLGQLAEAAQAEPALAVDDADLDAGRLDRGGRSVFSSKTAHP